MLTTVASVYRTLLAGRYDDLSASLDVAADRIAGSMLRLGSYGDPAAIPHDVWTALLARVAGHTGYTHQWRAFPEYADVVMASCNSVAERVQAKMLGFRTFRVAPATGWAKERREILCPASEQAGKKTTCAECRACGGTSSRARCDIVISCPWEWRKESSRLRGSRAGARGWHNLRSSINATFPSARNQAGR